MLGPLLRMYTIRMLSKDILKELEAELRKDKEKLWKEIQDLEKPTDFGDDISGDINDEEVDEDEELENTSSSADVLRDRLANVEDALNKIKTGEYGICEDCGREIEIEVLRAAPESGLCMECKKSGQ